jgi:dephospho-CoA kinase
MVYCVGLTGNIASGKTKVAQLFSKLGIEVIHADKIAKELTQKNQPAYNKIVTHYSPKILKQDKTLDRTQLREIIFANAQEREWLEHLLHPLIRQEMEQRVDTCTAPYCKLEIPLLITKQAYPYINHILLVSVPRETQIKRLMRRDQCSKEQAEAILTVQPNNKMRLDNADEILVNDMEDLFKAVNHLHYKYLQKSIE